MKRTFALAYCLVSVLFAAIAFAQDRETKVRNDRQRIEDDGYWIYNNLKVGMDEAPKTSKPLLVVFRCIPCEACAQLDSEVVERDPRVRELLDKFVCVRVVHANGLDLSRFQFDYDQSWAAFVLNSDGAIYGRYGTRSHQSESEHDVSLAGFAKALEKTLDLHSRYPRLKASLAGKTGKPARFKAPEELPALKGKYTSRLDYQGNVVGSCIHCHQVGESLRLVHREKGDDLPETLLFPYPHPKALGLILDPAECVKVKEVSAGSAAESDGYLAGDEIISLEGQPLISIADVQWILHNAPPSGEIRAEVTRDGKTIELPLTLREGWRRQDNISWRATSWDLRRMATGGIWLEELTAEERREAGLDDDSLALRAKYLGEYDEHAAALKAGFRKGDVLVSIDGRNDRMRETDVMAWLVNKKRGEKVPVEIVRDGRRVSLMLPIQ